MGRDPAALSEALQQALEKARTVVSEGRVATYIPELAKADPQRLGAAILTADGAQVTAGEIEQPITLQSIGKVVALIAALAECGPERVFERVGMEPSGDPFNSIQKLETADPSKPLNPMINAGAITVCGILYEALGPEAALRRLGEMTQALVDPYPVGFSEAVYLSERATGDRNRAMVYFLRDLRVVGEEPEAILDLYFRLCSFEVSGLGLARLGLTLALPDEFARRTGARDEVRRTVLSLMLLCGMYNASGEFAVRVGLPAKSGVSGGIVAVRPGEMGIGVIGPALDKRGNSHGGTALLRELSARAGLHLFHPGRAFDAGIS